MPKLFVKNDFPAQILFVKRFGQIRHDHDRKFQAFALVNAHQPDGIFLRGRGTSGSASAACCASMNFKKRNRPCRWN